MAEQVAFELVSPERILLSASVDMVVVPGADGDFAVLPGHALFISSVRPGVIEVFNNDEVAERIFVSGGFAEATAKRCIVLADEAVPVDELDREEIEAGIRDLHEDVADAPDEAEREKCLRRLAVAEAMLAACSP
ncbi:MAG: F0F1 ATP synthase subunit epsilon [Alphaproteobacteria bacterium]